ncbi:MAG: FAD-binding oxidoreductase [Saprospiraceae bacterium]|nr:FAD-binding oxidoreductase [Saprospiraceae bacterium]MCB9318613.1 FAD-binding oxidoreductase [Lewinellaceae bacterium]
MHIGIVGQGLAGTLMAFRLIQEGYQVTVIDPGGENSSTIASGLINPVTGRKYVKSWLVERLLDLSDRVYPAMEIELNIKCYHHRPLYRILHDHQQAELWMLRAIMPGYDSYLSSNTENWTPEDSGLRRPAELGKVREARWLDTSLLLTAFRSYLQARGNLRQSKWQPDETTIRIDHILWNGESFDYLLFAEGSGISDNPYFNWLPIQPSKGERLLIKAESKLTRTLKANYFIIPYREPGNFWIGSPTDFTAQDSAPSERGKQVLEEHIRYWLSDSFTIAHHAAAFRPASRDRRPVIGFHPQYPRIGVLNGLGTKGVSIAPYLADLMVEYLRDQSPFPAEVDIKRFAYPGGGESR